MKVTRETGSLRKEFLVLRRADFMADVIIGSMLGLTVVTCFLSIRSITFQDLKGMITWAGVASGAVLTAGAAFLLSIPNNYELRSLRREIQGRAGDIEMQPLGKTN